MIRYPTQIKMNFEILKQFFTTLDFHLYIPDFETPLSPWFICYEGRSKNLVVYP